MTEQEIFEQALDKAPDERPAFLDVACAGDATLRRRLDANASQVFLSGNDDVPEQYRKLVEQYYRSLSKGGGKQ